MVGGLSELQSQVEEAQLATRHIPSVRWFGRHRCQAGFEDLGKPMIRDAEVRPALRTYLEQQESARPDTILIEELGLCQGRARIDLATVSGVLHGYEIKSPRDRLNRLASQAATYSRVLDLVTLVVGAKHLKAALQLVPRWWGVLLVRDEYRGSLGRSVSPCR